MRFILIILLSTSFAFAKSKDSCYSVQLTSFVYKNYSDYKFENQGYPESCKLISFTNMNAIRCGCFEVYKNAKNQSSLLEDDYPDAKVVTTYKYRFANNYSKANKKQIIYSESITETVLYIDSEIELNKEKKISLILRPKEAIKSSKKIISKRNKHMLIKKTKKDTKFVKKIQKNITKEEAVVITKIQEEKKEYDFTQDITVQGHIDLTAQAYLDKPSGKNTDNYTANYEIEMAYNKDDFQAFAKFKAQQDYYDIKGGKYSTDRTFLRVDELFAKYDFEDDQIMFGKNIRFWGALEVRNITDNFNVTDLRSDPFETDKLGAWNATYTHYTDSGELAVIVKFYEQDRKMAGFPYVYYFFPETVPVSPGVELPFIYDKKLKTEKSATRPSIFLKYSGSTDTDYAFDYSIILENGYDSQRYYTQETSADGTYIQTNENAYLVNKIITYNTLVVGSTLLKLEAVYADVIDNDIISDYYHLGLGVEHTITQAYKEADLGLLAEYYRYGTLEDDKRGDLGLFELFQNDLFLGFRYSFNDGNDASIIAGVILDLEYEEEVYYLEYEARLMDMFKINFDYRYISPSPNNPTAFNLMDKHQRISLKMGYYF